MNIRDDKEILNESQAEISSPEIILQEKIEITKKRKSLKTFLLQAAVVIAAVVILFYFVIGHSKVVGDSMKPNYLDGDRVIYFRLTNSFERGDVIIFHASEKKDLIKRVIAVEGDTVDIKDNHVIVNGTVMDEDYIYVATEPFSEQQDSQPTKFPLTVEKDGVFVLGDNRVNSNDSRGSDVGVVKKDQIAGKVFLQLRF